MEFVQHDVAPFAAWPRLAPTIDIGIDRLARTVDVVRLKAGRRIWNALSGRERKHIALTSANALHEGLEKAPFCAFHNDGIAPLDLKLDLIFAWRPQAKRYPVLREGCAVGSRQHTVFHFESPNRVSEPL